MEVIIQLLSTLYMVDTQQMLEADNDFILLTLAVVLDIILMFTTFIFSQSISNKFSLMNIYEIFKNVCTYAAFQI